MVVVMTTIACNEKVLIELRKAVIEKYGKLHGCLRQEIDLAIRDRARKLQKVAKKERFND